MTDKVVPCPSIDSINAPIRRDVSTNGQTKENIEQTFEHLIHKPLTISDGTHNGKTYPTIYGSDGEWYGRIEGDKAVFMQNADTDSISDDRKTDGKLFVPLKEIEYIESDGLQRIIVHTTDGRTMYYDPHQHIYDITPDQTDLDMFNGKAVPVIRAWFVKTFPEWQKYLFWDTISNKIMLDTKMFGNPNGVIKDYTGDTDLTEILETIQEKNRMTDDKGRVIYPPVKRDDLGHVVNLMASRNPRNPFIDRIRAYDGERRDIKSFLKSAGFSAPALREMKEGVPLDDDVSLGDGILAERCYMEKVSRAIFLAALERQLSDDPRPLRFLPVIVGAQGTGKSLMCARLGLGTWHKITSESFKDVRKFDESVEGAVIVELSEGVQLMERGAGHDERAKAFLDRKAMQYRKAYRKDSESHPVRYLMIATTNDDELLTDTTGNTRYYPVFREGETGDKIPMLDWDESVILGYWADALHRYEQGERYDDGFALDYTNSCVNDKGERDGFLGEDFPTYAAKMQHAITKYPDGYEVVEDILKDTKIGDLVAIFQIKDQLRGLETMGFDDVDRIGKELPKILRMLGFEPIKKAERIDGKVAKPYRRVSFPK